MMGASDSAQVPDSIPLGRGIVAHIDKSCCQGAGGYGVVYGGHLSPSGQLVAIKAVQRHQQVLLLLSRMRKYQLEQHRVDVLPENSRPTTGSSPLVAEEENHRKDSTDSYGDAPAVTMRLGSRGASRPGDGVMCALPPHPILPLPSSMPACDDGDLNPTSGDAEANVENGEGKSGVGSDSQGAERACERAADSNACHLAAKRFEHEEFAPEAEAQIGTTQEEKRETAVTLETRHDGDTLRDAPSCHASKIKA
ncbi:putative CMGC kinase, MAPK family, MEK kinase-related (incomplete catalytic triad) [Neospora caninum Liverpool]|uniref:Putative CMGC kinase, MAPK family, MEK kinase-related (Incomplete catalytic triad) n=1 Tax=Neospora caninum (strain Liverpool) TaxID=572307 RepID=F0V8J1_NEOCL|nr:putative CMGC kinase, MAPK family, MEK kinase-related (incomplete catalytic triad) [Neospora caninum Liverpool]CBZ50032.1 putative CMGC kinase, MAPK family, MEK kinase-related (incomplete catalytic triad) [Neospora caninum Liverpool]|eukprot:XP_003880067.1 putative CMGC kinase, MAPK family, MEK kinase-related (incomplete catalytic triad) [Neospora caninum Liverpool]